MSRAARQQISSKRSSVDNAYRIIDANINRAKEGLRVCEEIARFYLKDTSTTKKFSRLRHRVTLIIKNAKIGQKNLLKHRDSKNDLGRDFQLGPKRKNFREIFSSNIARAKEALRVLEEFLKIFNAASSKRIQKLRFHVYSLEKEIAEKYSSLLDTR